MLVHFLRMKDVPGFTALCLEEQQGTWRVVLRHSHSDIEKVIGYFADETEAMHRMLDFLHRPDVEPGPIVKFVPPGTLDAINQ